MGTRGYRGYRHRRRFIYWYNHFDSYPSGLGLDILRGIPGPTATPEQFQEWLAKIREEMDRLCEEHPHDTEMSFKSANFSNDHPRNDLFIEWTYIVDLRTSGYWNLLSVRPSVRQLRAAKQLS
jgi:hypothetical protein